MNTMSRGNPNFGSHRKCDELMVLNWLVMACNKYKEVKLCITCVMYEIAILS